jgi:hypothetical protein
MQPWQGTHLTFEVYHTAYKFSSNHVHLKWAECLNRMCLWTIASVVFGKFSDWMSGYCMWFTSSPSDSCLLPPHWQFISVISINFPSSTRRQTVHLLCCIHLLLYLHMQILSYNCVGVGNIIFNIFHEMLQQMFDRLALGISDSMKPFILL